MTTTILRYNGRAFIYEPTNLVARDNEEQGNANTKERRLDLAAPEARWGFHERVEKFIGRLAMVGFVAATVTELISGEGWLHSIGL